jgi:hypothetical protein
MHLQAVLPAWQEKNMHLAMYAFVCAFLFLKKSQDDLRLPGTMYFWVHGMGIGIWHGPMLGVGYIGASRSRFPIWGCVYIKMLIWSLWYDMQNVDIHICTHFL